MKKFFFILGFAFMLVWGTAHADVLIIVNKAVPEKEMKKEDLQEIFLGKKVQWKDNSKIKFVVTKDPDLHKAFLSSYVKKSERQFKSYWKNMVFTGKGKKPKSLGSAQEVIDYVANTKGAIGYIDADTTLVNVDAVTVK